MQTNKFSTKIVVVLLVVSAAIATLVPYAWARINTGSTWRGVTPELSYDAMFYYARANDATRGHFFITNPYYFEHRVKTAAIPSADDLIVALPQFLGLSFNVGYYANIFVWSILLLLFCYALFRALALSPPVSFLGTLWCYIGVYGGMMRPGSMQIIFPLYTLFLIFFWRYINKKDASIFPLAIITGTAPYFYIHLFMTIVATLGVYALVLLFRRNRGDFRRIFFLGLLALLMVIPHAIHGFLLASQPFYWEALLHNGFLSSHWPQIEAYYYGRWIVLVLMLIYLLRRYAPEKINQVMYSFVMFTGFGLSLAMISNIFTGRDFEIAVHVARFSIFWYLMVGVLLCIPVYALLFRPTALARAELAGGSDFGRQPDKTILAGAGTKGIWLKRAIIFSLFSLLFLQMVINIGRSVPHFGSLKKEFVEAQTYAEVIDWLAKAPEGVVIAPEDINSYISTLTKQYVLYNSYGAHFAVSDEENQERYLLYRAFDHLTQNEFIEGSRGYYGPTPSYLAKTSALRYRFCTLLWKKENCPAPKSEQSFVDEAAMAKKFEAYYPDLVSNITREYAKYHVRYVVTKVGDTKMSGKLHSCVVAYRDQWFEVCTVMSQPVVDS